MVSFARRPIIKRLAKIVCVLVVAAIAVSAIAVHFIDPRALAHYLAPFRDPARIHAMCEDYRAGAYFDYELDKADVEAGRKITIPMLAMPNSAMRRACINSVRASE